MLPVIGLKHEKNWVGPVNLEDADRLVLEPYRCDISSLWAQLGSRVILWDDLLQPENLPGSLARPPKALGWGSADTIWVSNLGGGWQCQRERE